MPADQLGQPLPLLLRAARWCGLAPLGAAAPHQPSSAVRLLSLAASLVVCLATLLHAAQHIAHQIFNYDGKAPFERARILVYFSALQLHALTLVWGSVRKGAGLWRILSAPAMHARLQHSRPWLAAALAFAYAVLFPVAYAIVAEIFISLGLRLVIGPLIYAPISLEALVLHHLLSVVHARVAEINRSLSALRGVSDSGGADGGGRLPAVDLAGARVVLASRSSYLELARVLRGLTDCYGAQSATLLLLTFIVQVQCCFDVCMTIYDGQGMKFGVVVNIFQSLWFSVASFMFVLACTKLSNELRIFSAALSTESMEFSPLQLFEVNASFMYSMAGSMTTYVLIMVQFSTNSNQ